MYLTQYIFPRVSKLFLFPRYNFWFACFTLVSKWKPNLDPITSSPMEMLVHFLPLSSVPRTPFLQKALYEIETPSGSLLFSRITSDDKDCKKEKDKNQTFIKLCLSTDE